MPTTDPIAQGSGKPDCLFLRLGASDMDEVKGKVKGLMKKINNPFASTSSSSGKFKGQGRVLGSSSSSSSNQNPTSTIHRLQQSTAPTPAASSGSKGIIMKQNNTGSLKEPIEEKLSESLSLNQHESKIRDGVDPIDSKPDGFDPFDTLVSTRRGTKSGTSLDMFQCPVCSKWFNSEHEVSAHVENCLENNPTDEAEKNLLEESEARNGLVNQLGIFLSGSPSIGTFEILLKLLKNIVNDPRNEKFRRIRMSNPKIQETVGMAVGGVELLESVGFKFQAEGQDVWGVMEMPSIEGLSVITHAIALLEPHVVSPISSSSVSSDRQKSATLEAKKIDRQVRVFFSASENMAARIELPDSFYDLSVAEVRREAESRKKKIEDSQLLIPKSFREKQAKSARKRYKAAVIRIQFPDGVVLQGVFLPKEPTTALYEFVGSAIKEGCLEFELLTPALPKRRVIPRFAKTGERMPTLEDEDLVPTALVKFKPIETDSVVFTGLSNKLLEISEPLTSSAFLSGGGFVPGL